MAEQGKLEVEVDVPGLEELRNAINEHAESTAKNIRAGKRAVRLAQVALALALVAFAAAVWNVFSG